MLINRKADLFLKNLKGKTPMTGVNNNLLMIKILKKAEIFSCIEQLQELNLPKEAHFIDKDFI